MTGINDRDRHQSVVEYVHFHSDVNDHGVHDGVYPHCDHDDVNANCPII